MMYLHFGVIDQPYTHGPRRMRQAAKGKAARPRPGPSAPVTTFMVAKILEAKYHVMDTFWNQHHAEIIGDMTDDIATAMQNVRAGMPTDLIPRQVLKEAMSKTEERFKKFLAHKEMDTLGIPGVPTQASLEGVSHRFKNKRGSPGRPSFIDTGLYQASFKAWIDSR